MPSSQVEGLRPKMLKNAVHNYLKLTTLSRLFVLEQQALHFFKGKILTPKSILVQTYLLPTRNFFQLGMVMGGRDQIMCALPSLSLLFGVGKTHVF